jgi:hypothetical protein
MKTGLCLQKLSTNAFNDEALKKLSGYSFEWLPGQKGAGTLNAYDSSGSRAGTWSQDPDEGALRGLEYLKWPIGEEQGESLARWASTEQLPMLRCLDLSYGGLNAQGLAALWGGSLCDQLEVLDLTHNNIDDDGAALIAQHPRLALVCGRADIKGEPPCSPLAFNNIGDRGLLALICSPYIDTVKHLNLDDNPFTKAGLLALAADPALARFKGELYARAQDADEEMWQALIDSPYASEPTREQARVQLEILHDRRRTR